MLSLVTSAAGAANNQLSPEQVPSHEERTEAVTACLGGVLPGGIISLVSKFAMERFDDQIFGFQQWIDCWGATPVTFTKTLPELRDLVNQKVISGAQTEISVEQMNELDCADFLGGFEVCREENTEPTEELYECLNRRVRPQDKSVAGFTCVVTYIPQFVRKYGRILSVTARTLAIGLSTNAEQRAAAKLYHTDYAFDEVLTREDATRTEPSCYFVMEQDVAPNTKGIDPSILVEGIARLDKGWQLAEPRNFFATVFSRRAWKNQFLYGRQPLTYTYGQGTSRTRYFLAFGGFDEGGLHVHGRYDCFDHYTYRGAGVSRKFLVQSKSEK